MVALSKKMDIFGVAVLGLVTAVGGGVIRDLVLGITPPKTFQNPIYAAVAIATSLIIFIPAVRHFLSGKEVYDKIMLLMDSVGLGIFTVVGIETAYLSDQSHSIFLLIFVGVITGVGGGVLRDIMAGNTPYIFVRHVYASASLTGALLCGG
ncbi:MAG: TRIC cation channel family protein, partial [Oscillospiraceae bacterium]|nr:TRIC cation channel family protein [Oscillospiraceae bacterium]